MNTLFDQLVASTIGYDPLERYVQRTAPAFPKYNIVKEDENKYLLELALAGYSRNDISIELKEETLYVTGYKSDKEVKNERSYFHKGISDRDFTINFALGKWMEVKEAELVDGMLCIHLERIIPEEKRPKQILIKNASNLLENK